jgi:hypothetical protein
MEVKRIVCDICGREKRDGESWFLARQSFSGLLFQRERDAEWPRDKNAIYENICDDGCPATRLKQWLTGFRNLLQPTKGGTA